MTQISAFVSRDVLSKADCRILGAVDDVYFDETCKNIVYFALTTENGDRLIPFEAVVASADALVVENAAALLPFSGTESLKRGLIGKSVYTSSGVLKGVLTDVTTTKKGKVSAFCVGSATYQHSAFAAFGEILLLKDGAPAKKRSDGKAPKRRVMPIPSEDRPVRILPVASAEDAAVADFGRAAFRPADTRDAAAVEALSEFSEAYDAEAAPATETFGASDGENPVFLRDALKNVEIAAESEDFTPPRIIADYNFLLGRTLVRDLKTYAGSLIAPQNTFVTTEIVEKARKAGKLVELTLYSK